MKHAGAGLRLLLFVLVVCSAIALSGCDAEFQGRAAINLSNPPPESENENGPPQGGRIGIVLTDAPSDEFSAVEVTLSRIELLGDGESVDLFTGYHTFDLLRLRHFSNLFSVSESVPPGTYHKLRLTLDDLVLLREVEEADGGVMLEEIRPALPAAGVLEVDPREHFTVSDGGMLMIEVDIDAGRSIKALRSREGHYRFQPVVFTRILRDASAMNKLARASGVIRRISDTGDHVVLCSLDVHFERVRRDAKSVHARRCLSVHLFSDTMAFDANGDPLELDVLTAGDPVTVVGQFLFEGGEGWLRGDIHPYPRDRDVLLGLNAIVVEVAAPGTFLTVEGEAESAVDSATDRFELRVKGSEELVAQSLLGVQLQEETAIVDQNGNVMDRSDITPGALAEVDGVLRPFDDETGALKAALVVLEQDDADEARIGGIIERLDLERRSLELRFDAATSCIDVLEEAKIVLIDEEERHSRIERVQLHELSDGMRADVSGAIEISGCLQAEVVVAHGQSD